MPAAAKIASIVLGWPMWQTLVICGVLNVAFAASSGLWGVLVVDFIQLHAAGYYWPAFNAADSAITLGVILLLWDVVRGARAGPDAPAGGSRTGK